MAQPTSAVTRWELSTPYEEFDVAMNRRGFIGSRVLRPFMTRTQSANLGKVKIAQMLQQRETLRNGASGYGRDSMEFDSFSYATEDHGWESPLDDREQKIYRSIIDSEQIQAARAEHIVQERYERKVAAAVFNTSTWGTAALTTANGATKWTSWSSATPIATLTAARKKVQDAGVEPNALILNAWAFINMINCAEVLDRLKYTAAPARGVLAAGIAEALMIDQIIVAGGMTNTANQNQTASISRIWGAHAMICRVATTDDPREVCIGRTFMYSDENAEQASGLDGAIAVLMEEYRDDGVRGNVMRARCDYNEKIIHPEAGHLVTDVYS